MQALYQADLSGISIEEALKNILEEKVSEAAREFSTVIAKNTFDRMSDIDDKISSYSKGWPVQRMSVLDRSILRMAFYEVLFEKGTPYAVVADEAVELAKKYSGSESSAFINGILGSLIKDVKESGK